MAAIRGRGDARVCPYGVVAGAVLPLADLERPAARTVAELGQVWGSNDGEARFGPVCAQGGCPGEFLELSLKCAINSTCTMSLFYVTFSLRRVLR